MPDYQPRPMRPWGLMALELIEAGASMQATLQANIAGLVLGALPEPIRPAPRVPKAAQAILSAPFDAAVRAYSAAVGIGAVERSIIASQQFQRTVDAIERAALGPLARRR